MKTGGAVVSSVTLSPAEALLSTLLIDCVAVTLYVPSPKLASPEVVIVTLVPLAVACPSSVVPR